MLSPIPYRHPDDILPARRGLGIRMAEALRAAARVTPTKMAGVMAYVSCRGCGGPTTWAERLGGESGFVERAGVVCVDCGSRFVLTLTMRSVPEGHGWFPRGDT